MKNKEINNTTNNKKKGSTIWICFDEDNEYWYKESKSNNSFQNLYGCKIGTSLIKIFNNKKFIYNQISEIIKKIENSSTFNKSVLNELKNIDIVSLFFELLESDFSQKYCIEYENRIKNINNIDEQLRDEKTFAIRFLNEFKFSIDSYEQAFKILHGIPEKTFKKFDKNKRLYLFALYNFHERIVIPESIICYGKITKNKFDLIDSLEEFRPTQKNFDMLSKLNTAIKNKKMIQLQRFKIKTIQDFFNISLYMLMQHRQQIKECQNCGKYFHTHYRSSEKYCSNIFKNGKTCSQLSYTIKLENDKISKIYRKATINANTCKYRNKKIGMYSKNIERNHVKWKEEIKKQRQLCQDGKITIDQFEQWISNNKYWYKKR